MHVILLFKTSIKVTVY